MSPPIRAATVRERRAATKPQSHVATKGNPSRERKRPEIRTRRERLARTPLNPPFERGEADPAPTGDEGLHGGAGFDRCRGEPRSHEGKSEPRLEASGPFDLRHSSFDILVELRSTVRARRTKDEFRSDADMWRWIAQ